MNDEDETIVESWEPEFDWYMVEVLSNAYDHKTGMYNIAYIEKSVKRYISNLLASQENH